ncbi:MAG: hypothetical protein PVH61_13875 [Candidatus Aminicenantes bacterium]|jgi:hypothetical protein
MPLIDEAFFLTRHGQQGSDFPAGLIDSHLDDAEDLLREMTSDSKYEETEVINGKDPGERTPDEDKQLSAFQRAEAELLMYAIIPKLNIKIGREGIVQSAFSQKFGEGNFRIATPDEIEEMKKPFLIAAYKCVKKYVSNPSVVTAVTTT